mgnify:CR=1 FL=1
MFRIAVCDDEQIICSQIENIILQHAKRCYLQVEVKVFFSGEKLCEFIEKEHSFELIFLDIEMKTLSGIDVGKKIREKFQDYITKIVFISGKDGYDRQLFDIQPFNFIPKPIEKDKVIHVVSLSMQLSDKINALFSYKKGHSIYKVPIKDIVYFESLNREIKLVSTFGKDIFYGILEEIFCELEKYNFIQIHKSYIINYAHAIKFKYEYVIMSNSCQLPISQLRRKSTRELQLKYEEERLK